MLQHLTIVGGLILVNDAKVDSIINEALDHLAEQASSDGHKVTGDDIRKLGYIEDHSKYISAQLKKAEQSVIRKIAGELKGVAYVVNRDSKGVEHPKLRVLLGDTMLSLDLGGEYAQRLAVKLEGALADGVEGPITISSFVEVIERGGRKYANHIAAVKNSRGEEIKAVKDHFRIVQEQVEEATAKIRSKAGKAEERKAIKAEYFSSLVQEMAAQRPMPALGREGDQADDTPKPASQAPAEAREKLAELQTRFNGRAPQGSLPPRAKLPARAAAAR